MFRENWCESLWRVASVLILFIVFYFVVVNDFGERHSSLFAYRLCRCFVEMHLTVVGGCHVFSNFSGWFVLQCFFMISGSWKGQTDAYYLFYIGFIDVSWKLMWEFVEGCQCSNFVYFIMCFWWFRWTSQLIDYMVL